MVPIVQAVLQQLQGNGEKVNVPVEVVKIQSRTVAVQQEDQQKTSKVKQMPPPNILNKGTTQTQQSHFEFEGHGFQKYQCSWWWELSM